MAVATSVMSCRVRFVVARYGLQVVDATLIRAGDGAQRAARGVPELLCRPLNSGVSVVAMMPPQLRRRGIVLLFTDVFLVGFPVVAFVTSVNPRALLWRGN